MTQNKLNVDLIEWRGKGSRTQGNIGGYMVFRIWLDHVAKRDDGCKYILNSCMPQQGTQHERYKTRKDAIAAAQPLFETWMENAGFQLLPTVRNNPNLITWDDEPYKGTVAEGYLGRKTTFFIHPEKGRYRLGCCLPDIDGNPKLFKTIEDAKAAALPMLEQWMEEAGLAS